MRTSSCQSGNVVVYLLGAVALLGLLIVMVRGSSTPGSNIDAEQLTIKVSEVQQYGAELERAVQFILQNGYSETDIRFAHPDAHADYGDINDDQGRQVFHRMGGGTTFRAPPAGIQTSSSPWVFTAANVVKHIGTTASDSTATDLVAVLPDVTKSFCITMNRALKIENPAGEPPQDTGVATLTSRFDGSYTYVSWISDDATNILAGQKEGCFEGGGTPAAGTYHYYRVLLAR